MIQTVAMTNNWQIHLPLTIREALRIDRAMQFLAKVKDGVIILKPQKSPIMKHFGAFSSRKKIDIENLRDYINYSDL